MGGLGGRKGCSFYGNRRRKDSTPFDRQYTAAKVKASDDGTRTARCRNKCDYRSLDDDKTVNTP